MDILASVYHVLRSMLFKHACSILAEQRVRFVFFVERRLNNRRGNELGSVGLNLAASFSAPAGPGRVISSPVTVVECLHGAPRKSTRSDEFSTGWTRIKPNTSRVALTRSATGRTDSLAVVATVVRSLVRHMRGMDSGVFNIQGSVLSQQSASWLLLCICVSTVLLH